MPATLSTSIPGLPAPKVGKVREVYDLGDALLIVATDRISAFDVVMANGIPHKGRMLNQMSAFWFEKFADLCPNHVISTDDGVISERLRQATGSDLDARSLDLNGRCTLARKAQPLAIECVARGYITGSLFKEYIAEGGAVHGMNLPEGLVDSDKLPEPIFTPATKAEEGHDQNLSEAAARDLVGAEVYETVKRWTLEIYQKAADYAATKGILLADTKFEFGLTDDGIIWIDEALTPDSSRFWPADRYEPGRQQPSYDKQFVRNYLETLEWDKRPPGPTLPEDVVANTQSKYLEAFRLLTGRELAL